MAKHISRKTKKLGTYVGSVEISAIKKGDQIGIRIEVLDLDTEHSKANCQEAFDELAEELNEEEETDDE